MNLLIHFLKKLKNLIIQADNSLSKRFLNTEPTDNPFALSIGDLMAALLLIFILLLAATLLKLQDEFEQKSNVAERYKAIKEQLYIILENEFKNDLIKWNAIIDPKELSIRFKEPNVLFGVNQAEIKPLFKNILDDFFPRYIKVLTSDDFINNIEEIRIEGHTDSSGPTNGKSPETDYYFNMSLSQDRTRSVLEYSLSKIGSITIKSWVRKRLTANGLSSSKPITFSNSDQEDKIASRRVEFRVRTNAEEQINEILKYGSQKND